MSQQISELWYECLADSGNPASFTVGSNGITEIKCITYQGDRGGFTTFFAIYRGDKCIADIYNPSEVYYAD